MKKILPDYQKLRRWIRPSIWSFVGDISSFLTLIVTIASFILALYIYLFNSGDSQQSKAVGINLVGDWQGRGEVEGRHFEYSLNVKVHEGEQISGVASISTDVGTPWSSYNVVGSVDGGILTWKALEWTEQPHLTLCRVSGIAELGDEKLEGQWNNPNSSCRMGKVGAIVLRN